MRNSLLFVVLIDMVRDLVFMWVMQKTPGDFDLRNEQKKKIEFAKSVHHIRCKKGEIWWYREGMNVGSEISKNISFKRPCLILGVYGTLCLIVPLTTTSGKNRWSVPLMNHGGYHLKPSWFLISQIKNIDKKRLCNRQSSNSLNTHIFENIRLQYVEYIKKLSS